MSIPSAAGRRALGRTERSPGRFYSPQLDGLRFIAALLVFLSHAPPIPGLGFIQAHGWLGVDLFLCISAYLLTRLMALEYAGTGTVRIKAFFIRRMLRIWPLYLGYATLLCGYSWARGGVSAALAVTWWISHLTFTANVLTAWSGFSPVGYTGHLWTLALEEQVYLILPAILYAVFARRASARAIGLATGWVVALLIGARAALVLGGASHPVIYVLPVRADSIVLGVFAALVLDPARIRAPGLLALVCAVVFAAAPALLGAMETALAYQLLGYTIVAAVGCGLVLTTQTGARFNRLLAAAPLPYLGKISFGIYVFHAVALAAASAATNAFAIATPWSTTALALALTIGLAALSYTFYEAPFLRLKQRFTAVESRPAPAWPRLPV